MQDLEIQRRGVVAIGNCDNLTMSTLPNRPFLKLCANYFRQCIPIRLSSYHIVNPSSMMKILLPFGLTFCKERIRKRIIVHPTTNNNRSGRDDGTEHSGSHNNHASELLLHTKFKIPVSSLPTAIGGTYEIN